LVYFIVNPSAGSGKAGSAVPLIERIMRERGAECKFILTEGPGDIQRVRGLIDFGAASAIVCVGGDGTIQEYAGLAVNNDVTFGVIPAGSGNDFIYSMPGYSPDKESKFPSFEDKIAFYTEKILRNSTAYIDAISVNGETAFLNAAGTGMDVQVLKTAAPMKRFLGSAAYFAALITTAFTYRSTEMTMTVDGVSSKDRFMMLAICNGGFIGGNLNIAPGAAINDGEITLCAIRHMPRWKAIAMFAKVRTGGHSRLSEVSIANCQSVRLEFDGARTVHLDGNLIDFKSPLEFKILKNAVRLIV
jgi:YegS/Rv2252/BmrU family lipid kinase